MKFSFPSVLPGGEKPAMRRLPVARCDEETKPPVTETGPALETHEEWTGNFTDWK